MRSFIIRQTPILKLIRGGVVCWKEKLLKSLWKNTGLSNTNLKGKCLRNGDQKKIPRISLQYHPEQNDNSTESQKRYQEIQDAYELLIYDSPINYQINLGVSETELTGLKTETDENENFVSIVLSKLREMSDKLK